MAGVSFSQCIKKALPYCLINGLPFYEKWEYFSQQRFKFVCDICVLRVNAEGLTAVSSQAQVEYTHLGSQYPDTTVTAGTAAKGCPDPVSIIWSISLTKCSLWIRSQKPTLFSLRSKKPAEKVRSESQPLSWSQPSSLTHREMSYRDTASLSEQCLSKKVSKDSLRKIFWLERS